MKLRTLAILAGAGLTLASCGGGGDAPSVPDANVTEIPVPETPATQNVSTEEPATAPTANAVPEPVPSASPTPFSDREQTEADAAATGMTARVDRNRDDQNEEKKQ